MVAGLFGAVEKLVNDHDVAWLVFFLQRADSADTNNPCDPEFFHGPDVGAVVQFAGQNPVATAMAREKNNVAPGQFAGQQIVGGIAERSFDFYPLLVGEPFEIVKPGAADDADLMFCHGKFLTAKPSKHTKKAEK